MTVQRTEQSTPSPAKRRNERLFLLELSQGQVLSMRPDGSDREIVAANCARPDGAVVDSEAGHIYWTNMGPTTNRKDGSIERADLDGSGRQYILPPGAVFTPKQLHLEKETGKLYWCDREGMRVMRCNLDGSDVETLIETGDGEENRRDQTRWCVGITVDPRRRQIYWTQKGGDNANVGRILRAGIDMPKGETAARRSDVETFFNGLPEPIDLEIDHEHRLLYWTDRGDAPRGNTVNRTPLDAKPAQKMPEIVLSGLMEGIGIALDVEGDRMFVTDLAGTLYTADLDGGDKRAVLVAQGNLTGVVYAGAF